jgi:hypothetical protein
LGDPTSIYPATGNKYWQRMTNVSRNFIWLTPELGDYLHQTILTQVTDAVAEYHWVVPYWFVAKYDAAPAESITEALYDQNVLLAKAYILKQNREELLKYLDVPAFARGDLFYLNNLITVIEAPTTTPTYDFVSYRQLISVFNQTSSNLNLVGSALIDIFDINKLLSLF